MSAVYGEEKDRWLAERSDVFVLPSHNDAYPLVVLEAFRGGLPVISTFQGAIPEMVKEGYSGFIVNTGDVESIAQRMFRFLTEPALLSEMKIHAIAEFQSRFTFDVFEKRFVEIVDDILSQNERR